MAEPVRLVIWDLDDTFWQGTLSEGGITYVDDHHNLVQELAARGIMSSICSKNDHGAVEAELRARGLWDTFIFPSINWEPKGQRIAALIEAVQLRPESVLLIDDNHLNINEARHYVPGIQTADETLIPHIASDPRFKGKNDVGLTRLAQYKNLERRHADMTSVSEQASNHDFLRASGITLTIDYDVEAHLDRAIELINRTNQLNFTKSRLDENIEVAREQLAELLRGVNVLAGLVRVRDRYGAYGDVGLFVLKRSAAMNRLVHFCFSCRTLNMGVEQWVYRQLDSPKLTVVGEVIGDVFDEGEIDWIHQVDPERFEAEAAPVDRHLDEVRIVGSCDMLPLEHYFRDSAMRVQGMLTFARNGLIVRPDTTVIVNHTIRRPPEQFLEDIKPLNFLPEDFEGRILKGRGKRRLYILSFAGDFGCPVYQHNETGQLISLRIGAGSTDIVKRPLEKVCSKPELAQAIVDQLRDKFTYVGLVPRTVFRRNLRRILNAIPSTMPVALMLMSDVRANGRRMPFRTKRNELMRAIAAKYPNVRCLGLEEFVQTESEKQDANHYDRMVYYRLFQHLDGWSRDWFSPPADAPQGDAKELEHALAAE